jgi:hypothetical protein
MSAASDDLFDGWFAYKKRSGEDVQKRRIGHGVNAPTSLTLREQFCVIAQCRSRDEISVIHDSLG